VTTTGREKTMSLKDILEKMQAAGDPVLLQDGDGEW